LVYPFGGELLAVQIDGHPKLARALAAIPGVKLIQNGVRDKTFTFPIRLFGRVAALVKPHRRRRVSERERRRLAAIGFRRQPNQRSDTHTGGVKTGPRNAGAGQR
jgi:hypothetical protein